MAEPAGSAALLQGAWNSRGLLPCQAETGLSCPPPPPPASREHAPLQGHSPIEKGQGTGSTALSSRPLGSLCPTGTCP